MTDFSTTELRWLMKWGSASYHANGSSAPEQRLWNKLRREVLSRERGEPL